MTRALVAAATLSILAACSGPSAFETDGGHVRQSCLESPKTVFGVKVVDATGKPVEGATVSGTNGGTGKAISGSTDGNGVCRVITEELGAGDIQVKAFSGGKTSAPFTFQFTCSACDCIANPGSATLTIQ